MKLSTDIQAPQKKLIVILQLQILNLYKQIFAYEYLESVGKDKSFGDGGFLVWQVLRSHV